MKLVAAGVLGGRARAAGDDTHRCEFALVIFLLCACFNSLLSSFLSSISMQEQVGAMATAAAAREGKAGRRGRPSSVSGSSLLSLMPF